MKKQVLMLFLVLFLGSMLHAYEAGEVVDNLSFTDVDFGDVFPAYNDRTIDGLIGEGKPIVIYYESASYA